MNWRKNWAIVPIEIATTPCLQPFESEIVCINKALAFFFKKKNVLPNANLSMSHISAWNSGQWSWQNVIYWHWNVPDPQFTFPAFQAGFHIQWPFWRSGRASQLPWATNSQGVAGGQPGEQLARARITSALFQRRRSTAINLKRQGSAELRITSSLPHIP